MPIKVKAADGQEHEVPTMEEHQLLLDLVGLVGARALRDNTETWERAEALAEKLNIPVTDDRFEDIIAWQVLTTLSPPRKP
jgi:hypothetical protein